MALFYALIFTIFKRRTNFEDGTENSTESTRSLGFWDAFFKCIAPVSPSDRQVTASESDHQIGAVESDHHNTATPLPNFYPYVSGRYGTTWEVPERYQGLEAFGDGECGNVAVADDTVRKEKVAIKKLSRCFQSDIHAKRTYREFSLLRHMEHENVIILLDVFTPQRTHLELQHIYLVMPYMDTDLQKVIKSYRESDKLGRLTDGHVQVITYRILCGLKYIHSAGVIHRDLKPANIAINTGTCAVRILDFGLSRHAQEEGPMTGYVVTRWYRAPEIIVNWAHYTGIVDIWSVGCIMAELITLQTLFPGSDYVDQMKLILNLVGAPSEEILNKIASGDTRNFIASFKRPKDFGTVFPTASQDAVNLLKRMLEFDPDSRITAAQALAHGYFNGPYRGPEEQSVCVKPYDHAFEDKTLSIAEWREMVFREVKAFSRPPP